MWESIVRICMVRLADTELWYCICSTPCRVEMVYGCYFTGTL